MDSRKIFETLFASCLIAALVGGAANARTIHVDDDAAGVNDGSSWADAYKYLQDALNEARSAEKPVEIWVAKGTYRPDLGAGQTRKDRQAAFRLIDAVTLKGGFAGSGEPDPGARDVDLHETVLSGDLTGNDVVINDPRKLSGEPTRTENSYVVVASVKTDKTAVIDGFTITAGSQHGMYNRRGSPTVANCTFSGNQANCWGGGMCSENGSPRLSNCTFSRNWAQYGGGLWSLGGTPVLTHCTFTGNSATYGGGMYNYNNSHPRVINCTFTGNSAKYGGAMYSNNNCRPAVTNCTFTCNVANGEGGAMRNIDNCSPTLTNCILWGNTPDEIVDHFRSSSTVNYSHVRGGRGKPWFGEGCIDADPLFVGVDDLRLSPDSPCIDAGDNTALPSEITTGLGGNPRFINGKVDMGAFEAGGSM
ncbi:MAG: right-handed parallel beta-helix repeat-containing protein [Planctomycetota bacterium]